MNQHDLQFRIRQHLNASTRELSPDITSRLHKARQKALDRQKVAVMPGESFGAGLAGWLRLSLTQPDDRAVEAANRIAAHAASILGNAT